MLNLVASPLFLLIARQAHLPLTRRLDNAEGLTRSTFLPQARLLRTSSIGLTTISGWAFRLVRTRMRILQRNQLGT